MKKLIISFIVFFSLSVSVQAKEMAGVSVADTITSANNETLTLNGMGLREKLWLDIYVGSLYLVKKSDNVAEILSQPNALRIQLDFIYSKVTSKKLLKAWKAGFEKNQSADTLKTMQDKVDQFYGYFAEDAVKGDQYIIDYVPGQGSSVSKNSTLLGTIEGANFKNALVEIWLGNKPADKKLKKGMLGLK